MHVQRVILLPPDAGEGAKRPLRQRRRAKVGMGGERRRYAASLFTPTFALSCLRGRGAGVPISWGLL
jgi:hypothetical protein